jgi:hypothetical protein
MRKYFGLIVFSLTTLVLSPSCDKEQEEKEFVATEMELGCLSGSGNIIIQTQEQYEAAMSNTEIAVYPNVGTCDSSSYPAVDFTTFTLIGVVGGRTGCGPPPITSSVELKGDVVTFNFEVPIVDTSVPTCQTSVKYYAWYKISKTSTSNIKFEVKE